MKYLVILAGLLVAIFTLACNRQRENHTLRVAATALPQAEMLEYIKPDMQEHDIDLEIIIVEDYNVPNRALAEGEVDANFFQHQPFLESQMAQFKYPLVSFAKIHIEPMGLYSKKIKHLTDLPQGAKVGIPSDPSNQARALLLLESQGLLQLTRHDMHASLLNIDHNPKELKLLEIDAPLLAHVLDDVDLAAINTNFALQAGFSPLKDALAIESSDSPFVNILAVRAGDENREDLKILKSLLKTKNLSKYIQDKYKGAVILVD